MMVVPYAMEEYFGIKAPDLNKIQERYVEGFTRAVHMAKKHGICICFEDMPVLKVPLANTTECMYLIDQVPGLEFAFDTANYLVRGEDGGRLYEQMRVHIQNVHLKDVKIGSRGKDACTDDRYMQECCYGEGVVLVGKWLKRLQQDGYTGYYGIENAGLKNADCDAHEAELKRYLHYLKEIL